ncbi:MAG: hypothetical protein LBJ37_22435 [Paucimonas sp.]|jgi:hypothetical protein|nr:hypothetical protein [Paucimonas sp.]
MSNAQAKHERPWEDTLILAFRDMQWIERVSNEALNRTELAQTPGLLLKFDGNAESAVGDVLASQDDRYFLLEFKATLSGLDKEREKDMYTVISEACNKDTGDPDLTEKAELGHFLVFPHPRRSGLKKIESIIPVHDIQLNCISYPAFTREPVAKQLRKQSAPLREVFYGAEKGLDLAEMADYLNLLAKKKGDGGDSLPINAAIASPSGLFWPGGQLRELRKFVQTLELQKLRLVELEKKKALEAKKAKPTSTFGKSF